MIESFILISKFKYLNLKQIKETKRFSFEYSGIKTLINVNTEFCRSEFLVFRRFSQILNNGSRSLKIREFWEVRNWLKAFHTTGLGTKKASAGDAKSGNSGIENGLFLVQNVKN